MWIPVGKNSYLIFEVFEFALDLDEPWKLMNLEFDVEAQTWHLYIDFKRGATIKCPLCDSGCRLVPRKMVGMSVSFPDSARHLSSENSL